MASVDQLNELGNSLDPNQLFSGFWKSMPPELMRKFELTIDLGIILIIISIAYLAIILLIAFIKWIFGTREAKILKKINNNLEEILNLLKRKKSGKTSNTKESKKE